MSTVRYMLDTNIVSYLVKQRYPEIDDRLARLEDHDYCISVITRSELMFGLHRAESALRSRQVTLRFLDHVQTLPWTNTEADTHARLCARLHVAGTPIGILDEMIAAHAIALGATLVTNNVRHFGRLQPELTIENWVAG